MWIRIDDSGWCHDIIWGDMWTGTDDKLSCPVQIESAMWIGKNVKEIFTTNLG
jgi:hypothetical protein